MRILKSMRFKFSIVAFLFVFSGYLFANAPIINSFKANRYEGFDPMSVKFTVDATDPEGDTLNYTFHIFDEEGFQTDVISETGSIVYDFNSAGNYTVRVTVFGSHNESTESKALSIRVLPSDSPITISILTSRQMAKILNEEFGRISAKTNFFNNRDNNVTLHIRGYNNGELIINNTETLLPHQGFTISEHYLVHPTTDVIVTVSAHIPVASMVYTPEGVARAWYRFDNTIQMYVPYIEENTNFRNTYAFISNPNVKPVGYTFNEKITELPQDYTIILNAGSYVPPFMEGNKCWGLIKDEIINTIGVGNTFVEEKTLNGLGISVDFDKKPALYELKQEGSTVLYLPFIPHTDCYNDLVLLNTGDRESDVTIAFYNGHGIKTGEYNIIIPQQERVKLYLETILDNLGIEADYAVITSIQPLIGVNEVKLLYGGQYAFTLQPYEEIRGISPVVMSDDYYWTALSLVNPNDQEISVTFTLFTASGKYKASQSITIPAHGSLATYVRDIFNNVDVNNGDSIVINALKPISGITLMGNNSLTRLSALPIF